MLFEWKNISPRQVRDRFQKRQWNSSLKHKLPGSVQGFVQILWRV